MNHYNVVSTKNYLKVNTLRISNLKDVETLFVIIVIIFSIEIKGNFQVIVTKAL